jgi:hypothetical protein
MRVGDREGTGVGDLEGTGVGDAEGTGGKVEATKHGRSNVCCGVVKAFTHV